MALVISFVLVIAVAWYLLSKLYADKIGEFAKKEYKSICERDDKNNV